MGNSAKPAEGAAGSQATADGAPGDRGLDPSEADRYARAYRPSWAGAAADEPPPRSDPPEYTAPKAKKTLVGVAPVLAGPPAPVAATPAPAPAPPAPANPAAVPAIIAPPQGAAPLEAVQPQAAPALAPPAARPAPEVTEVLPRGRLSSVPPAPRRRSDAWLWLAIAVAAMTSAVAWLALSRSPSAPDDEPAATADTAHSSPPPAAEPPGGAPEARTAESSRGEAASTSDRDAPAVQTPSPSEARAPAPAMASLSVRTRPAEAEVFIDGRAAPNPFEGEFPVGESHRVEAKLDGHSTEAVTVVLDRARRVMLTLSAQAPARRAPPRTSERRPPRRRAAKAGGDSKGGSSTFVSDNPY